MTTTTLETVEQALTTCYPTVAVGQRVSILAPHATLHLMPRSIEGAGEVIDMVLTEPHRQPATASIFYTRIDSALDYALTWLQSRLPVDVFWLHSLLPGSQVAESHLVVGDAKLFPVPPRHPGLTTLVWERGEHRREFSIPTDTAAIALPAKLEKLCSH